MGVSLWDIPVLTTTTGNTKPAAVLAELTWIYAISKKGKERHPASSFLLVLTSHSVASVALGLLGYQ